MSDVTFRPLPAWPHPVTRNRRWHPFSASWTSTLTLLVREITHLRGRSIILAAGFREQDLRLDGWPRSGIPEPPHPGVELSFDSVHGRLVYATDVCAHWQDNVRSLALGLESLRAVDRFGISQKGEQYAGWKALPSGGGLATAEDAWKILVDAHGGGLNLWGEWPPADPEGDVLERLYRAASLNTHPDVDGGSAERFVQVKAAFDFLKTRG